MYLQLVVTSPTQEKVCRINIKTVVRPPELRASAMELFRHKCEPKPQTEKPFVTQIEN